METRAGIRELKARLSAYLRRVKTGGTVLITERGTPVGRIVPVGHAGVARIAALREAGLLSWNGLRLRPLKPVAKVKGIRTIAELLLEDRE